MMPPFDELHFSALKWMALSPSHFCEYLQRGHPQAKSVGFRIGRAVHSLALGGPPVAVYEGRRDKRSATYQEALAETPDGEILTGAEYDLAQRCRDALFDHPEARRLIESATLKEHSFEWERNGFRCKGRLDLALPGAFIADLKVVISSEPVRFQRDALRAFYHAQLPWYGDGLAAGGTFCPDMLLIAVERPAPHAVTVHRLDDSAIDLGRRCAALWLEQLRVCVDSDRWPGYSDAIVTMSAPDEEYQLIFPEEEEA